MESQPDTTKSRMGQGLAIGVAIGVGIGVALDNIATGIAVGIAIGAGIGATWDRQSKKNGQSENSETPHESP